MVASYGDNHKHKRKLRLLRPQGRGFQDAPEVEVLGSRCKTGFGA